MADSPATNSLFPHLVCAGAARAIDFYKAAFGAEEMMRMPGQDGKRLMHVHLKVNGGSLMMNDDYPEFRGGASPEPASVTLHLQVEDADSWWNRAIEAGATPTVPLADQFWGDRYGQLKDPFGHTWSIGASKR